MLPDRKELSPAQIALLDHITPIEANNIYQELHITLQLCIDDYFDCETDQPDPDAQATPKVLNAWGGVLRLMLLVHDLSIEHVKKISKQD